MNTSSTSHLVVDFARVAVAPGLACPICGGPFTPHSMIIDGDSITLRCGGCHVDALKCEPAIVADDENAEDEA